MANEFLNKIMSLAESDDETMLLLKQVVTPVNGEIEYYSDGTPRSVYPAYLPRRAKIKDGESWYINTGIYVKSLFPEGKPRAMLSCVTHVAFMMLDDIGSTKVYDGKKTLIKTPPLKPSWVMETSEGSFQWGYIFSIQPTKEEYTAAINAIIEADYTDHGATNAVRNCRLPGSVNLKKGRDNFKARLVEFNPDLEYSLDEICAALGVTPHEAATAGHLHIKIKDTGTDSVLTWLNDNNYVCSKVNSQGWVGVVCPNADEHSDGAMGGTGYQPTTRSFKCFHGHCSHLDSKFFASWVEEKGGPKYSPGLRDDLLNDRMQRLNEALPENNIFNDTAAKRIGQVERYQAGRAKKEEWFKRFFYVMDDDSYFDKESCIEYSRGTFNAIFRHVHCVSTLGLKPRRIEASVFYDELRESKCEFTLKGVTYAAGESDLVHRDGLVYGNRWRNARPDVTGKGGDVSLWLDHCETLIPDERERNHVLDLMAFKVQHPNIKINHAVLHGGNEGRGKDTLWAPFIWAVCGPNKKNYGLIDNDSLSSQWGYALESEILVLNELKEPDAAQRRALANKLKPIIAAPPDVITINRKGLHPYDMLNRLFVLAFSNDEIPISLPTQDRRWFCIWSSCPRMNPEDAQKLWGWYYDGGFEAIGAWLHARDVSAFNPTAAPMETDYKRTMIVGGLSTAEAFILHQIETRAMPFDAGVIGGPWYRHCETLMGPGVAPAGVKIPQAALLHALKEAGWIDMGMCFAPELSTKRHIYVRPDRQHEPKAALRRAIEPVRAEGNVTNLRDRA
ncbi:MAG: hypothetical protein EB015_05560 [Methylocystaceae bacterium]|nr:hypothetical protein [Methylocystaceae bacterium]